MKTLQKATLAVAIAAAPFLATNALEALDDEFLSEMTGQAGVTIETTTTDAGTTIGHIYYTDNDGLNQAANAGGSVAIVDGGNGFAIKTSGGNIDGYQAAYDDVMDDFNGANAGGYADEDEAIQAANAAAAAIAATANLTTDWNGSGSTTTQTIDVDSMGNLVISKTSVNQTRLQLGQVQLRSKAQHDARAAGAAGAILVSNLDMVREDGDGETRILNLTETANEASWTTATVNGVDVTYYKDINGTKITDADEINVKNALDSGANLAIVTKGKSKIVNMNVDALDGAVQVRGLSYTDDNAEGGFMASSSVIWAKSGNAYATAADVAADTTGNTVLGQNLGGGVYIQGSDSVGTLRIQSIGIAGNSIGSVEIGNISQAGNITRIYGH